MDVNAQLEISRWLESGESLIWAGVPKRGLVLRTADAFMIPFSVIWCGFAIFWEATALTGAPLFFSLWGIPFVLVGVYLVVGRFVVDAKLRAKTYYGLTDRRVLIVSGLLSHTTSSLPLRTLQEVSVHERADRSGSVIFGHPYPFARSYAGTQWPGMGQYQTPSFDLIQDAKWVHDKVLELRRAAV